MNNNNMGRVAVRTSARKRSATPIPYDVNSTFGVGAIKPLMIREVIPNSSISVKTRNLIRLGTMNVPTYGRLKLNMRHYFVGMSDLTKNFGALMSEQVISRAHGSFKPISLPCMTKGFLNLFSLVGAHVSLYRLYNSSNDTTNEASARLFKTVYKAAYLDQPPDCTAFWKANAYQNLGPDVQEDYLLNDGDFYKQHMPADWQEAWNGYNGPALNICKLMYGNSSFGTSSLGWEFWIPIENKDWTTFFDVREASTPIPAYYNTSFVPLDKADAVLSIRQRGSALSNGVGQLACRFSNFGIRWRDLMIMSGTGIDYNDWTNDGLTSLMPIFAYYKAYWESFGLELYKKWETSAVVKMMCVYDDQNEYEFERLVARTSHKLLDPSIDLGIVPQLFFQYWCNFVCDVGTAFYTEEKDFTSIHTRDASVSPNINIGSTDLMNGKPNTPTTGTRVANEPHITQSESISTSSYYNTPWISGGIFSQLDIETLKRMYKVVNRNTIAGQNIAKLLELQGLGSYVESCKSRFIGEYDVPIDIDEVTATADFFDADGSPRSLLGAQGAKGVGFGASKRFKVSTNEFGYFIVLSAIVPESGYINLASASARNLRKTQFYNPEFDGLGMELNTKELTVTGEQDWSDAQAGAHLANSSFGFAPQYSRHKIQGNYALSGMSLRSERDYFRSFFLDKCIDVGERFVKETGNDSDYTEFTIQKTFTVDRTPIASPNWQFVGRYPWIENYLRIFAETGDPLRKLPQFYASLVDFASTFFDFTIRDADKFIVQNRFIAELSSPWLKITDSFETKEDGNVGSTDLSIGKA